MGDDSYEHLRIKGRPKLPTSAFASSDRLYRAYYLEEVNESGLIDIETLGFPDLSCNWSQYSLPEDVRFRKNGRQTDGCYSFSVETGRYRFIATPVHDPVDTVPFENYAHVEVRELQEDEHVLYEPPKRRKLPGKKYKIRRKEYRRYLVQHLKIEIHAIA